MLTRKQMWRRVRTPSPRKGGQGFNALPPMDQNQSPATLNALGIHDSLLRLFNKDAGVQRCSDSEENQGDRGSPGNTTSRETPGAGTVRFNQSVKVVLVPSRKDYHTLQADIWWQEEDYRGFRQEFVRSIRAKLAKQEEAQARSTGAVEAEAVVVEDKEMEPVKDEAVTACEISVVAYEDGLGTDDSHSQPAAELLPLREPATRVSEPPPVSPATGSRLDPSSSCAQVTDSSPSGSGEPVQESPLEGEGVDTKDAAVGGCGEETVSGKGNVGVRHSPLPQSAPPPQEPPPFRPPPLSPSLISPPSCSGNASHPSGKCYHWGEDAAVEFEERQPTRSLSDDTDDDESDNLGTR
ncbi:unnamed protein product, partial [Discosporangium mesarthrocarpum]